MFYKVAEDGLSKAPLHFQVHHARLDEFHVRGVLLMAGAVRRPGGRRHGMLTTDADVLNADILGFIRK